MSSKILKGAADTLLTGPPSSLLVVSTVPAVLPCRKRGSGARARHSGPTDSGPRVEACRGSRALKSWQRVSWWPSRLQCEEQHWKKCTGLGDGRTSLLMFRSKEARREVRTELRDRRDRDGAEAGGLVRGCSAEFLPSPPLPPGLAYLQVRAEVLKHACTLTSTIQ